MPKTQGQSPTWADQSPRWLPRWLEELLSNPAIGAFTAVTTIVAGASFQDDILNTAFHVWPLYPIFLPKATVFWSSILIVALLMGGTQAARAQASKRARAQVDAQVANLENLVHRIESLPPENFLADYQALLRRAASSTIVTIAAATTAQQTEAAIRNVLAAVIELALEYDKRTDSAVYAANIMIFRADWKLESDSPVFFGKGATPHPDFDGVIELVPALSTTSTQSGFGPDPTIAPLLLQVPKDRDPVQVEGLRQLFPVLPGAAWAFVYNEYAGFPSIGLLDDWLDNKCSAEQHLIQQIRDYFRAGPGRNIRSMASMPIPPARKDAHLEIPIAVLNLHSDREGLLGQKGGERFGPLLEPFRMLLSILLAKRMSQLQG